MSDEEKPASTPEPAPAPAAGPSEPKLPAARKPMPTMLGVAEEASPAHLRGERVAAEAAPLSERKPQPTGELGVAAPTPDGGHERADASFTGAATRTSIAAPLPDAASVHDEAAPIVATQPGPPVVLTPIADMLLAVEAAPASEAVKVHELRAQVIAHLGPGKGEQSRMMTRFISFGFKYGLPVDADLVLDVRLLDNPYFVPELRNLAGTDAPVRDYILRNPDALEFIRRADDLLAFALPRYEREGKSYLTVAIGCTGGRHRSVTVATALAEGLREKTGLPILVLHRDVGRSDNVGQRPSPPPGGGRWDGGTK